MMDILQNENSLALNDDIWNFIQKDRDPSFGKTLFVDRNDPTIHHIFLDDNADSTSDMNMVGVYDL